MGAHSFAGGGRLAIAPHSLINGVRIIRRISPTCALLLEHFAQNNNIFQHFTVLEEFMIPGFLAFTGWDESLC